MPRSTLLHAAAGMGLSSWLPFSCALCGQCGAAALCELCSARYFAPAAVRCRQCALPLQGAGEVAHRRCGACLAHAPSFDATFAACDYGAPVDQLVLGLKFGAKLALAPWMAAQLAQAWRAAPPAPRPDLLCPVPLGPLRLRERGFNQALEMAKPLARTLAVPLAPRLLVRVRETPAQAMLLPDERADNIRGAFSMAPQALAQVKGKHVGVVDDVMTTGQTLAEIAALLKRFGAARVTNFVFARTPAPE